MSHSYRQVVAEDCRLIILRALADESDLRLNEKILEIVLQSFGHSKSRDYIRQQLRHLEDLAAVRLHEPGTVLVAELLRSGADHIERRSFLVGVGRPSVEG